MVLELPRFVDQFTAQRCRFGNAMPRFTNNGVKVEVFVGRAVDGRTNSAWTHHPSRHCAVVRFESNSRAAARNMRWPDGLSIGPGNRVYVDGSCVPDVMMQSKAHAREKAPSHLFRFPADGTAPAGQ